jgi:AraC family transcriptional regulator of adaptative response / DNA-3-methyladenine glycosylase II
LNRAGQAGDLFAPPQPADVANLSPEDLLPLQLSRQKAGYLIGVSRLAAQGELDLRKLRLQSATRAERTLLAVHGLGPWSVNVTSGLQARLRLDERPDADATRRLMAVFSPYRSFATAHLWQFGKPAP